MGMCWRVGGGGSDEDVSAVRRLRRGLLKRDRKSIRDVQMFGVQTCVQKCCIFHAALQHDVFMFLWSQMFRRRPMLPVSCVSTDLLSNSCMLLFTVWMFSHERAWRCLLVLDVCYLCSRTCCVAFKCMRCCWEGARFFVFLYCFTLKSLWIKSLKYHLCSIKREKLQVYSKVIRRNWFQ